MSRGVKSVWLVLLLAAMLPAAVQAQFTYTTNDGAITITGYTGSNGMVTIPETIDGLPVVGIGDWAFYAAGVTNVLIADTVTNIGDGVFFDCESLTNVVLGSSVASIGDWAFGFCPGLISVCCRGDAPGLGGGNVFYGNAATVYYLSGTTNWGPTFGGHPSVLWNPYVPYLYGSRNCAIVLSGYLGPGGMVTIPSTIDFLPVINTGYKTFSSRSAITSVTIPHGVTTIGPFSFSGCGNLSSVAIPDSVTTIEGSAFFGCSLTNIALPHRLAFIGAAAFQHCTNLTDVVIPNGVTNIGTAAFSECSSLSSIAIPGKVTELASAVFAFCTSLTNVTIPDSVMSIGKWAFSDCTCLPEIAIPSSVTNIIPSAFDDCVSLTAINVAASNAVYSSLEGVLFDQDRTALIRFPGGKAGSYTVPDGVTGIQDWAFSGCTNVTYVTIPDRVTHLGAGVFYFCTRLTGVRVPNGISMIPDQTFEFCFGLTNVTIPSGVTGIGALAFDKCHSLTSITIPNRVTSLGEGAFGYCPLQGIFFCGNAPAYADEYLFYETPDVTVYYLPGTTGWGATYSGRPTALWLLPYPTILDFEPDFGVRSNKFGFTISWATNIPVVVEACTSLSTTNWQLVQTNTLTAGTAYFSDPEWTNFPSRFYRVRPM
jgi:hypothetical protein